MARTRSKRVADTSVPVEQEPAKKRQPKRRKKEVQSEPEPEHEAPETEVVHTPVDSAPVEVVPDPTPDIPIDEEENYVEDLKEAPRASDLYLDTVST